LIFTKGDCNTPTIATGLAGPPPASSGAPKAPTKGASPTKPGATKAPKAPPPPGSKSIPDGALAGIIVLAFLIVVVLVATIVFVCVKSSKSGVENF